MNSLFIGLGKTGIASAAKYAEMAHESEAGRNDEFLYLDTDKSIRERYPIVGNDFIHLGDGRWTIDELVRVEQEHLRDPYTGETRKRCAQQFLTWFDQASCNTDANDKPIDSGTDGNRMYARAMLYRSYYRVKKEILSRLPYRDEQGRRHYRKVFVISGSSGGTGSGIVIDILYLLNEFIQENRLFGYCAFDLLLVMPQGYIVQALPNDVDKLQLNAYACIEELNACLKDRYSSENNAGMQMNKYKCCDGSVQPVYFSVCANAFLFDSVSQDTGEAQSMNQISENIASFLLANEGICMQYYWLEPIWNRLNGQRLESSEESYIKGFATTGIGIIQTWEELTRKYVHDKFIYQMLQYGFVGMKYPEIEPVMVNLDDMVYRSTLDKNIKNASSALLMVLLNDCKNDRLKEFINAIQNTILDTGSRIPNIASVYGFRKKMDDVLSDVRQGSFSFWTECLKKYNICHTLTLVERLRKWAHIRYTSLAVEIHIAKIGENNDNNSEQYRKDCESFFRKYIAFLVCRHLSESHLAHCEENLRAVIDAIDVSSYTLNGKIIAEWESYFVEYICNLRDDGKRTILPSLNLLIDSNNNICHPGKTELERNYSALITQTEDGLVPKLHYNLDNDKLLYTYKYKCMDVINKRMGIVSKGDKWDKLFRMDCDKATFITNISSAFDIFAKEVEKQSCILSKAESLSVPLDYIYDQMSDEEQDEIKTFLLDSKINYSASPLTFIHPWNDCYEIVIGKPIPKLWEELRYHSKIAQLIESHLFTDRIIKAEVQFGHALDDYCYYNSYKAAFERYLHIPENERHHQPFIDKRFLTERRSGETLADMFLRDAEQDR